MPKISNHRSFRWALVTLLIIILAGASVFAWHTHNVHEAQNKSGAIPTSKKTKNTGGSSTKSQTATGQTNAPSSGNAKLPGSPVSTSAVLAVPFGTFVSNHRPGQNGSPKTEQSVCNTTPGATCDIQFTNAGVTKSLGAEAVDSNGTAYWSWNINGGTLAPGSWRITAVVKLNGQTKTASDPTLLEVQ